MWQRFTEKARCVVYFAQEDARKRGQAFVDTEHLLIGVLQESADAFTSSKPGTVWPPPPQIERKRNSIALQMLTALGISAEKVQAALALHLKSGDGLAPTYDVLLAPGGKKIIGLAYAEARRLNHNHIGTEHILLGLISSKESIAGQVLTELGAELEQARIIAAELRGAGTNVGSEHPEKNSQIKTSKWWNWWSKK